MMNNVGHVNKDNFQELVLKSSKLVLVDFWAKWCGPCRTLNPILEEIAEENGDSVQVYKIDVDENSELTGEYGIRGIPTLILFKDGQVKKTLVGSQSKEAIKESLKET